MRCWMATAVRSPKSPRNATRRLHERKDRKSPLDKEEDSMTRENSASPRANFELAQKCLIAIRDIADRAVRSLDPENMGHAIQELTQVLVERTGNDERLFEPVSIEQINDLPKLYAELDFVDRCSQDLVASAARRVV